jgi:beta-lactamase superfamily II metal-dependent hydrolase
VSGLPELLILDVGHGNCAILRDTMAVRDFRRINHPSRPIGYPIQMGQFKTCESLSVIDCGYEASTLLRTLRDLRINAVNHVLISHADSDHIGGLARLIEAIRVHNIYLNPDSSKKGKMWKDTLHALELAERSGTQVHMGLTSRYSGKILSGEVTIEILSPSASLAASGSGGTYLEGHALDSNTLSVVIGLIHKSCRVALLPGDMSEFTLNTLLKRYKDIEAQILVFPHHGGSSGSADDQAFAEKLCALVKPRLVLFSLHRNLYENPKEEVVRGVLTALPDAHIMCTQLSVKCSPGPLSSSSIHLTDLPAKGKEDRACCGGTIRIHLNGDRTAYDPALGLHRQFVKSLSLDESTQENTDGPRGPLCLHDLAQL